MTSENIIQEKRYEKGEGRKNSIKPEGKEGRKEKEVRGYQRQTQSISIQTTKKEDHEEDSDG